MTTSPKIKSPLVGGFLALLVAGTILGPQTFGAPPRENETDPVPEEPSTAAVLRLGRFGLVHRENVSCVAFAPDGKILATGAHDRSVRLWEAATGRELRRLPHGGWVRSLVWTPDGKGLFSASDNEGVRLWDVATGKELRRLGDPKGMVTSLALTADGKTLTYFYSNTFWDCQEGWFQLQ